MLASYKSKLLSSIEEVVPICRSAQANGKRVVLMKGVYDLCHAGHVRSFVRGGELGDILIVAVALDEHVSARKGKDRPYVPLTDRLYLLANLQPIDFVCPNPFEHLSDLIDFVSPDIFTASHFGALDEQQRLTKFSGVRFVTTPRDGAYDTTALVRRIRESV